MPTKQSAESRREILERIDLMEQHILKSRKYLESRKHAQWIGFRPLFAKKVKNGVELPPHKDWVKNVFLPSRQKELNRLEKLIEQFESNAEG